MIHKPTNHMDSNEVFSNFGPSPRGNAQLSIHLSTLLVNHEQQYPNFVYLDSLYKQLERYVENCCGDTSLSRMYTSGK